ncbi:F-box domain-containing protein [Rhynchospora pubera]|uniref:F-box domain-containing protein n=1 Tax=Rhynchospora pubera TaxID=906938 RepID=A0AAV8GJL5_9POAL|nr:F-box domain-containing protein [Rhynchospora pubera]
MVVLVLGVEKEDMACWSELPSDMVQLISKKLHEFTDFIRFRAVCKNWWSSTPISDHPPLLPWLLFVSSPGAESEENNHLHFCSLSSQQFYSMPDTGNTIFCKSSLRYLFLRKGRTLLSFFNPIKNHGVRLPPITLGWFDEVHIDGDGDSVLICRNRQEPNLQIYRWQLGDEKWSSRYVQCTLQMLAYYKGLCFNVNKSDWTTKVFYASTGEHVLEMPPPMSTNNFPGFNYLVKSSEELLGVCRLSSASVKKSCFDVYRLHCENGNFNWVKVSNIGNCIILLDNLPGTGLLPCWLAVRTLD